MAGGTEPPPASRRSDRSTRCWTPSATCFPSSPDRRTALIHGVVVVDKPAGLTSHDVVAQCRRTFGQRRVGHSGTLDPDATGILLVGLGRATRLLRFLTALRKSYEGEVVLGVETGTLDSSGEVTAIHEMSGVTLEAVRSAAQRFVGTIEQVPPMVSAIKVGGRRLYEAARAGEEVARAARLVTVDRFDVSLTDEPAVFGISVQCSSGTDVRSLAADLGTALGGGAHLRNLRRTGVGSFTVAEAHPVDQLTAAAVLAPVAAMRDYPAVTVDDVTAAAVSHGTVFGGPVLGVDDNDGLLTVGVVDGGGNLLAMYERAPDRRWKPAVVMAGQ